MAIVLGIAFACILVGLAMAGFAHVVKPAALSQVVYYVGIVLIIVGLILLLAPVIIWLDAQIRSMLRT